MSANRKLQTEIDRVLKKVEEGVEQFDDISEKVHSASGQSLAEKYEGDLKKEIKKLQRLRDQIKSWLGSSDIKDKSALTEARKLIELKMEEFKVCEKDLKAKTFSAEGIPTDDSLDPQDILKEEKKEWIQGIISLLEESVETMEADLDKLSNAKPKSKHKDKIESLEARVVTSKWHLSKLEQIIKFVDDDSLDPNKLDVIKDDLDFVVENIGADEDAGVGMESDDYNIYEDLELDTLALGGGLFGADPNYNGGADSDAGAKSGADSSVDTATPSKAKKTGIPIGSSSVASITAMIPGLNISGNPKKGAKAAAKGTAVKPTPAAAQQVGAKATASNASSAGKAADKKSSVAAKGEDKKPVSKDTPAPAVSGVSWAAHAAPSVQRVSSGNVVANDATAAPTPAESMQQQKAGSSPAPQQSPQTETTPVLASKVLDSSPTQSATSTPPTASQNPGSDPAFPPLGAAAVSSESPQHQPGMPPLHRQSGQPAPSQQPQSVQQSSPVPTSPAPASAPPPGSLNRSTTGSLPMNSPEMQMMVNMMKTSMNHVPPPDTSDRQKGYTPRTPYMGHPSFPTQQPSIMENPALFEKLPMDTLFLSFYYQQGSYQQYLSARQLKKHSWRFHKKYMTWFQRHEEPKVTTDDYEEGTYVYFDYESGWCQRIKSEFKFEYAFLEDELPQTGGES